MQSLAFVMTLLIFMALGAYYGGFNAMLLAGTTGFLLYLLLHFLRSSWTERHSPRKITDIDQEAFAEAAVRLAARVVRSDGAVDELELGYVQVFMRDQFGNEKLSQYWNRFIEELSSVVDLKKLTLNLHRNSTYSTRLQMVHFLNGIAFSNYKIVEAEMECIKAISAQLRVSKQDFEALLHIYKKDISACYKTLGITPSVKDEFVHQALKIKQAQYDPDQMIHLGEGIHRSAIEKANLLQQAYTSILKDRGISL